MGSLKELIGMGFSPMMALVIGAVIVLWGVLCAVVVFGFRHISRQRLAENQVREAWRTDVQKRLDESEGKHEKCEEDRRQLRDDFSDLRERVQRFERCPHTGCPMRLP